MIRQCDAPGCSRGVSIGKLDYFFSCIGSKLRGGNFSCLVFCPEHKERMLGVDDGDPTTNPDLNKEEPEIDVPVYDDIPEPIEDGPGDDPDLDTPDPDVPKEVDETELSEVLDSLDVDETVTEEIEIELDESKDKS